MNAEFTGFVCNDVDALRERVWMSDITIADQHFYEEGAIVPEPKLWKPTTDQLKLFCATDSTPDNGTIELVAYSEKLRTFMDDNVEHWLPPTKCAPNQLTTTENTRNVNMRPGMHFDSLEHRPLAERLLSKRRIGLNTGPGMRFLLVGSVDAFGVTSTLGYDDTHKPITSDVRQYVAQQEAHPNHVEPLRCLWVLLQRGEAYLAPTENIVHDGSTAGMPQASTIHFRSIAPERGSYKSIV
ncbi:MAG: hypothetical protein ACQR33_06330 [Candidatus Saccharibacteria bacterium]